MYNFLSYTGASRITHLLWITSRKHLLWHHHIRNNLKDPGGLRTSTQYIFAMYLQTSLIGTLEEKTSLSFLLHAKDGSGQTRQDLPVSNQDSTDQTLYFKLSKSKAFPRQFSATVCSGCCQKWLEKPQNFVKSQNISINSTDLFRTAGVDQPWLLATVITNRSSASQGPLFVGVLHPMSVRHLAKHDSVFWDLSTIPECNNFAHKWFKVPDCHKSLRVPTECWEEDKHHWLSLHLGPALASKVNCGS